jgi:hypothetical protein
MTAPTPSALIYMTGRNCARYVRAAIESVAWQTHPGVHILFVDDCSDDATPAIASQLLQDQFAGRHTLHRNPAPWGKARSAHVHLRAEIDRAGFVAVLDADDQFSRASALAELAAQYQAGYDVVWTNFETDGGGVGANGPLDPLLPPRGQGWRTSHLFSFRAELLANVPEDYFKDERGQWLTAACDFALAYPVLDQTRRYKHLPVRSYRYTTSNPASHHNRDPQSQGLNSRHQQASAAQVLAKPALPCTRWALGEHGATDDVFLGLRQQLQGDLQALARRLPSAAAQAVPIGPAGAAAALPVGSNRPAHEWAGAATLQLAQWCPQLLDLMIDHEAAPFDARTLWQWWRWLGQTGRPPQVLEIGAGPLAAPLHAMVKAQGGRITSVSADRNRCMDLWARLDTAGLNADVLHLPLVDLELAAHRGQLPDLTALADDATGFDVLVVSAGQAGAAPADALLALPLAVDRLDPTGFRVCVWRPGDVALGSHIAAVWAQLAPELELSPQAFSGQALCAHSASAA